MDVPPVNNYCNSEHWLISYYLTAFFFLCRMDYIILFRHEHLNNKTFHEIEWENPKNLSFTGKIKVTYDDDVVAIGRHDCWICTWSMNRGKYWSQTVTVETSRRTLKCFPHPYLNFKHTLLFMCISEHANIRKCEHVFPVFMHDRYRCYCERFFYSYLIYFRETPWRSYWHKIYMEDSRKWHTRCNIRQ